MNELIETNRLRLERFSVDLARAILSNEQGPDWADGFPAGGERRVAEWMVRTSNDEPPTWPFVAFVVRQSENGQLIGSAGFHGPPRGRVVEIGYGLVEAAQRKGFASEVCRALADIAFNSGEVDRILATIDENNAASRAVLVKCGFSSLSQRPEIWALDRI